MAAPNLRFVPDYRLEINGRTIPAALRASITSVRYQDGIGAADRVEVGFANANLRWLAEHIRGLGVHPPTGVRVGPVRADVTAGGLFDLDNTITLAVGYAPDALVDVFAGNITGIDASFPSGGMPALTLVAHDRMQRLAEGSYARGFGPLPDALIVKILSLENLLLPVVDPAIEAGSAALAAADYVFGGTGRKQRAQSDKDLLAEIAKAYDADFWVEGDILYLARFVPKEYASRLTLSWGESLVEFTPRMTTVGHVASVSRKFTLREIPLSFQVSVFWDLNREAIGISVVPGEAAAGARDETGPTETRIDEPVRSPADIARSAIGITRELREKLNGRLTGSGTAVGDPRIRAGAVITLEGLGPDFSGDYRVSSATHALDAGGYRTSFEVRREILP